MDEDPVEVSYERAVEAQRAAQRARELYEAAARRFRCAVWKLRVVHGESKYRIGQRLGMSTTRVTQIVDKADQDRG